MISEKFFSTVEYKLPSALHDDGSGQGIFIYTHKRKSGLSELKKNDVMRDIKQKFFFFT